MDPHYVEVPRYAIPLSAKPSRRWDEVAQAYSASLLQVLHVLEQTWLMPGLRAAVPFGMGLFLYNAAALLMTVVCWLDWWGLLIPFAPEIWGFARASKLPTGKLVILQYVYEACCACTSVVVENPHTRTPVHCRTMDWNMGFDLRPFTIVVDFVRPDGSVAYSITTWAGYVGALTGIRPGAFAVSLNYRTSLGSLDHLESNRATLDALSSMKNIARGHWSSAAYIRKTFERCTSYEQATKALETCRLVSPCYFIVSGSKSGQGMLITRSPKQSLRPVTLQDGPIVQCNSDHWLQNPVGELLGDDQIPKARRLLKAAAANDDERWSMLSTYPVRNEDTIYACVMLASARDPLFEDETGLQGQPPFREGSESVLPSSASGGAETTRSDTVESKPQPVPQDRWSGLRNRAARQARRATDPEKTSNPSSLRSVVDGRGPRRSRLPPDSHAGTLSAQPAYRCGASRVMTFADIEVEYVDGASRS